MSRKLAIVLAAAALSLGVAAMPTGATAHGGGGGGGHGGGGGGGHGGGGGGRSFSFGPGRGIPGGAFVNRGGRQFVAPGGVGQPQISRNLAGRSIVGKGRYAWIGGRRVHGRRLHGFLPGIGYAWYWYYDDCYVWTAYGWINLCGYDDY
jgi:hypothetical protein